MHLVLQKIHMSAWAEAPAGASAEGGEEWKKWRAAHHSCQFPHISAIFGNYFYLFKKTGNVAIKNQIKSTLRVGNNEIELNKI